MSRNEESAKHKTKERPGAYLLGTLPQLDFQGGRFHSSIAQVCPESFTRKRKKDIYQIICACT